MIKLYFDCRDIFRAPRFAFSMQKMWIQLVGGTVGYVLYFIMTYLGFWVSRVPLSSVWKDYKLLPCFFVAAEDLSWISWILYSIGIFLILCSFFLANTAVARATYMTAKGNIFYSWKEAYRFAFRKFTSVILTPVSLIILIVLMLVGGGIVGLIGRIPYAGIIGISLFTTVWFLAALFIVFLALITLVSLLIVPSIIATTDEDAFEAVFQSFSVAWSQPWRLIFYEALTICLSIVSMGIFAFFVKQAIVLMNDIFIVALGDNFSNTAYQGQYLVQNWLLFGQNIIEYLYQNFIDYVYFSNVFKVISPEILSPVILFSSYLYAVNLLFIGGWVLSFGFSTFTTGNLFLYLTLRRKKDGENLLERVDKEEEEEDEDSDEESGESIDDE